MVKSRYIWDKLIPPSIGILIMGPYKPLRNWVDEFIPYYMEMSWELIDPIAQMFKKSCFPYQLHLDPFQETPHTEPKTISSWWFFATHPKKYAQVKLDHFPKVRDENKKSLSCHQLDFQVPASSSFSKKCIIKKRSSHHSPIHGNLRYPPKATPPINSRPY